MTGVYEQFYNLIAGIYGMPAGAPESVVNAIYWLSWSMVTFILLLVFVLFIFGFFMIFKTLVYKRKKNKQEIHYYYHK